MLRTLLPAALALVLAFPIAASAAAIHASAVTLFPGAGVTPARGNGANALGAADGRFLSLGLGGAAVFRFAEPFTGPVTITEVTHGNRAGHVEAVRVFVSDSFLVGSGAFDASAFTEVGRLGNATGSGTIDVRGRHRFLALLDASPRAPGRDGFDVDSITVWTVPQDVQVAAVPLPASGLLLLGGGAVLGALARRRRRV